MEYLVFLQVCSPLWVIQVACSTTKPPFSFRDPSLLEDRIQGKWLFELKQLLERHTGLAEKIINQG